MSDYAVSVDEAISRLVVQEDYDDGGGPRPCVHTFRAGGLGLLGAHWGVEEARAAMEKHGVSEAGPNMAGMGHPLALIDETGPVFFEAHPSSSAGCVGDPEPTKGQER